MAYIGHTSGCQKTLLLSSKNSQPKTVPISTRRKRRCFSVAQTHFVPSSINFPERTSTSGAFSFFRKPRRFEARTIASPQLSVTVSPWCPRSPRVLRTENRMEVLMMRSSILVFSWKDDVTNMTRMDENGFAK